MSDPVRDLCEFLAHTGFADLPAHVVARARQVTADTVAAMVGGSAEPEVQALTATLLHGDSGHACVLGTTHRASARNAGFINATAGTFLEMDEGNQFCRGHPAIHALPAALAHAQARAASGETFLLAMVMGYEVGARIGIGARLRMSMHPHGTWGTVGAAVAVARLAGADPDQMRETINVASSLGLATSRKTMLEGGTVRNSFAGFSAQAGSMAVDMVAAGFIGERDGLASVWGGVASESWDPGALTDALGERYEIARNYFKRHACCRYNHGALDALARIRAEHRFDAAEVASVRVETYALAAELDNPAPRNTLAAKFSVPFAIASTLVNDGSGLDSFTLDAIGRDDIRALAAKVSVVEDPACTALLPDFRPARVTVTLADGRAFNGETRTNRGDTEDPYDQAVLTEKYFELTTRVWDRPHAQRVFDDAMSVDRLDDMRSFTLPLVAPVPMSAALLSIGAPPTFDVEVDVAIVGAGACGLTAALAARDAGARVLVIERDAAPGGSTALSSGFIPACATRWQAEAGIDDDVQTLTADVMAKARGKTDPDYVTQVVRGIGPTLHWLHDAHGLPFVLIDGFTYPGHSVLRMHAHPSRTGRTLVAALDQAASAAGADLLPAATARTLFASPSGDILGLAVERLDGRRETIGCRALVLACNGFAGNPEMVARHIPEMAGALFFGHAGNQGHAMMWGQELGARLEDLGAYQGHGSVATPHGALITWAIMMEGGIQVNDSGERFSNEHQGYSEQAVAVLAQPGGTAWNVYDGRLHALAMEFEDYRDAVDAGAVREAPDARTLAGIMSVPGQALAATLDACAAAGRGERRDPFGRDFHGHPPMEPPLYAVRVTGALFHTQGGLSVNERAQVLREDGTAFPNLYAGGGAARGLSGPAVWGYLSGNGLLGAVSLGRTAGHHAARQALDS